MCVFKIKALPNRYDLTMFLNENLKHGKQWDLGYVLANCFLCGFNEITEKMHNILFICTGNYYRSRFAEEYFNHLARTHHLDWQAHSRGLSQNMPSLNNPGPISVHTIEGLKVRKVKGRELNRYPRPIEKADFTRYEKIIAMSAAEHRPMLESRFLAHCAKVEYFEVGDLPLEHPKSAIHKIACEVEKLVAELKKKQEKEIEVYSV